MNGSDECNSLINNVKWTDPTSLLVLAVLLVINVMVVVGNCLVIAAVYISSKLRTVTNLFIVSLAVADLMVGVAVLPFSATWEVFKVWIFGDVWCSIWLAVDVWMCTASILNLCAISLDRYVAVTRPVNYPSIMSSSRAKILIAGVWILSFVICFPPLVGWKDSNLKNDTLSRDALSPPFSGSGTVRIRGSHTVVTSNHFSSEFPLLNVSNQTIATDDAENIVIGLNNRTFRPNVVLYHTNYSEFQLKRNPIESKDKDHSPFLTVNTVARGWNSTKLEHTSVKNEVIPNHSEAPTDYDEVSNYVSPEIDKSHRNVTLDVKLRHKKQKQENKKTDSAEYSDVPEPEVLPDRLSKRSIEKSSEFSNQLASFSGVPVVVSGDVDSENSNDRVQSFEDTRPTETPQPLTTAASGSGSGSGSWSPQCPWTCELTSDTGYVIYSALGSFFIPMGVMLFFYWRIYRAAVQTTRAINQGFRTTKGTGAFGNRFDEQRLTLRIHRGRGSVQNHNSTCSSNTNSTNGGNSSMSASPSTNSTVGKSPESQRLSRTRSSRDPRSHEKIKISVSYPSSDQISSSVMNNNGIPPSSPGPNRMSNSSTLANSPPTSDNKNYLTTPGMRKMSLTSPKKTTFSPSPTRKNFLQNHFAPKFASSPKEVVYSVHYSNKNGKETTTTSVYRSRDPNCYLRVTGARLATSHNRRSGHRSLSIDSTNSSYDEDNTMSRRNSTRSQCVEDGSKDLSPSPTFDDNNAQKPKLISKMGKRNIKAQVKRFRMETKAAKTLGIIVGGFILCWMPFFTIYLIRAFCPDCINPIVFSILFWLGYCNSAINPCIYALFSKDFRFAFKKIICRCLCGTEKQTTVNLKRRGSDGSQLKTPVHDRQRSPSYNPPNFSTPNSVGEDSDPGGSDSR